MTPWKTFSVVEHLILEMDNMKSLLLKALKRQIWKLACRMTALLSNEIDHLLRKEVDLGDKVKRLCFPKEVYCFGLQYTFFEEIEDERTGERPNDVYFSLTVFIREETVKIEQGICGLDNYMELPDIAFLLSDTPDFDNLCDIQQISQLLVEEIQVLLRSRNAMSD